MDARGLVAVIITVHEGAVALAALSAVLVGAAGILLLRRMPPRRRALTICAFAAGSALLTFATTSHWFDVHALDVEVVRVHH